MIAGDITLERYYRIICLKRSSWEQLPSDGYISDWYGSANLVYWRPDCLGYTEFQDEAGYYTLEEIANCAGSHGDWLIEPVWCKQ
tara:strand:+ start:293 stop:547 length:255 start_codon:yes stop_codon:yes gene_type:complete